MARHSLHTYVLSSAIAFLLCLVPAGSAVADAPSDETISWIVRDTSVSREFIRSYLATLSAHMRKIPRKTLDNVRINNIIVVHIDSRTRALSKIHLLDRSSKPYVLDPRVIAKMPTPIIGMLVGRMYAWDEIASSSRHPYPDDVMELLELRNNRRIRAAFWRSPLSTMLSTIQESQVAITPDYYLAASLGNTEYGYPFGSAGLGRITAGTKNTKVYLTFPVQGVASPELKGAGGLGFSIDGRWLPVPKVGTCL